MRAAIAGALLLCAVTVTAWAQPDLRVKAVPQTQRAYLWWTPVAGATQYQIRSGTAYPSMPGSFLAFTTTADVPINGATGLVFQVHPQNAQSQPVGSPSNVAVITYGSFAESLPPLTTLVKVSHVTELRTRIDAARRATGLANAVWTTPASSNGPITAANITEMRTKLNDALTAVGYPTPPAYTDSSLVNVHFKSRHLEELRSRAENFPELVLAQGTGVSEPFFSPNANGVKDVTTLSASLLATGTAAWRVDVKSSSNSVVRSWTGSGSSVFIPWDGRDGANALQPDGAYTFEIVDLNGWAQPIGWAQTTLDNTVPAAAIATPAADAVISNVRQSNGDAVPVTGTATDANLNDWVLLRIGSTNLASGTSPVSPGGTFGLWPTLSLANGPRSLKLTVTDRAGNESIVNRTVNIGHFSASQNANQMNVASAQTVAFTSIVPFTLDETLVLKNAAGQTVRTLVSGSRAAGTYNDVWNGTNDAGQLVGDGPYTYVATVIEGSSQLVWDQSSEPISNAITQHRYVRCRKPTDPPNATTSQCEATADFDFDPFTLKPLRLEYCVDESPVGESSGSLPPACEGSLPAFVTIKVSGPDEATGLCDNGCIWEGFQSSGFHKLDWFGSGIGGAYLATNAFPRVMVLRDFSRVSRNLTLVYGATPVLSGLSMPPMFNPDGPPFRVTVNVDTYQGRTAAITARFTNNLTASTLRTITLPQAAEGLREIVWDGRADNGAFVAAGLYEVSITATDSQAGSATIKPLLTVRY